MNLVALFPYFHPLVPMLSQDKEGPEWKEMQLPSNADSVSLQELSYGSDYKLEVVSVNRNGSSIPATFNFTIADQPGVCSFTPYIIQLYWHKLSS